MIWLCLYRCLAPKPPLQELTDFVPPSLTEWGEPYWNWVAMTLEYAYPRWSSCCHSSSAYLRAFGGSLSASATTGNKLSHSFNLANCTTNYRGKQIFAGIWSWQEAWDIIPSRTGLFARLALSAIEAFARSNEVFFSNNNKRIVWKLQHREQFPLSIVLPKTGAKPFFSLALSPMDHIFWETMPNPTRPVRPPISSISSSFRIVSRKSRSNLRSNEVWTYTEPAVTGSTNRRLA
jgi:hypothetical protein